MQVSRLVSKMKEESGEDTEGAVRKQLREKITALTQSRLPRVADALVVIWNGVVGPLDLPAPEHDSIAKATISLNRHVVKLALLKSILTGTFIDVQFFAYKTLSNGSPANPRPLYTSSIVIKRWGAAIATRESEPFSEFTQSQHATEETAGMDSQSACILDGVTDDYEDWDGDLSEAQNEDKAVPYVPDLRNARVELTSRSTQEVLD